MNKFRKKIANAVSGDRFSSGVLTALVIAVIVVANIVLYTIVQLFGLSFHMSEKKDLSIKGNSDVLFADAINSGEKVTITFFQTEKSLQNSATGSHVYSTATQFEKKYPDFIDLRYINVITKLDHNGKIVNLDKYTTDMEGNPAIVDARSVLFECGNNYRVVSDIYSEAGFSSFFTFDESGYETAYIGEEVMTAMVMWVLSDEHSKAYFTENHGETADIAFSTLLACAGYSINYVDLRSDEVPEDCELLIISSPTSDFEQARENSNVRTEIERIKTYLDKGGNLYVALDPMVKKLTILENLLSEYGISYSTTESDGAILHNYVKDGRNSVSTTDYTMIAEYSKTELASAIKSRVSEFGGGSVLLQSVAALELSGNASPLLMTSKSASLYADGKKVSDEGSYCIAAYSELDTGAKVFVIPSIYLTSSGAVVSGYANRTFAYALFENLYGREGLPYGCNTVLYNTSVIENLSGSMQTVFVSIVMSVPVIVAIVGAVITIRRKNR